MPILNMHPVYFFLFMLLRVDFDFQNISFLFFRMITFKAHPLLSSLFFQVDIKPDSFSENPSAKLFSVKWDQRIEITFSGYCTVQKQT